MQRHTLSGLALLAFLLLFSLQAAQACVTNQDVGTCSTSRDFLVTASCPRSEVYIDYTDITTATGTWDFKEDDAKGWLGTGQVISESTGWNVLSCNTCTTTDTYDIVCEEKPAQRNCTTTITCESTCPVGWPLPGFVPCSGSPKEYVYANPSDYFYLYWNYGSISSFCGQVVNWCSTEDVSLPAETTCVFENDPNQASYCSNKVNTNAKWSTNICSNNGEQNFYCRTEFDYRQGVCCDSTEDCDLDTIDWLCTWPYNYVNGSGQILGAPFYSCYLTDTDADGFNDECQSCDSALSVLRGACGDLTYDVLGDGTPCDNRQNGSISCPVSATYLSVIPPQAGSIETQPPNVEQGGETTFALSVIGGQEVAGEPQPADIIFILDRSGSMADTYCTESEPSICSPKIDWAKDALDQIFTKIRQVDNANGEGPSGEPWYYKAGIETFNHEPTSNSALRYAQSTVYTPDLYGKYSDIEPCGCTGIDAAIVDASSLIFQNKSQYNQSCGDGTVKQVVILASDGMQNRFVSDIDHYPSTISLPNPNRAGYDYLREDFSAVKNDPNITFHTIGIGEMDGAWKALLQEYASEWGSGDGIYVEIPGFDNLYNIYESIFGIYSGTKPANYAVVHLSLTDDFEFVSASLQGAPLVATLSNENKTVEILLPNGLGAMERADIKVTVKAVGEPKDNADVIVPAESYAEALNKCGSSQYPFGSVTANIKGSTCSPVCSGVCSLDNGCGSFCDGSCSDGKVCSAGVCVPVSSGEGKFQVDSFVLNPSAVSLDGADVHVNAVVKVKYLGAGVKVGRVDIKVVDLGGNVVVLSSGTFSEALTGVGSVVPVTDSTLSFDVPADFAAGNYYVFASVFKVGASEPDSEAMQVLSVRNTRPVPVPELDFALLPLVAFGALAIIFFSGRRE